MSALATADVEGEVPVRVALDILESEVCRLRSRMFATLAHGGSGQGARQYSRKALGIDVQRVIGQYRMVWLLVQQVPGGGELSEQLSSEIYPEIREAKEVAEGKIK